MNNDFISIMTERIVRAFDPLQIILFGSQARGDADRNSDIDLLVVFSEIADKRKSAPRFCLFLLINRSDYNKAT